ncbi:integral membrane sensor signal transduction histidine kinase [Anaeromyxobacter sp. K]|uniref:sensor histidine kinase n=1 Tax=Anaeromyxobacter sp. (strain K) TaxID=447217 RepID=UPI00015F91BE|nr:ATP-binding protein [Anaeromyxobacter sp. K]ACG73108.1 integral membrane sensor signal transduction histidine kinase [Anaeromyxobacter sp. K]
MRPGPEAGAPPAPPVPPAPPPAPAAYRTAPHPAMPGGIRRRVYLLMATGIAVPLVIMGATGIHWARNLDDRVVAGRMSAAAMAATHFDGVLTEDLEVLQRLASGVAQTMGNADLEEERRVVADAYHQFRHREGVYLLDAERNVLAEAPGGPRSAAPADDLTVVDEVLRTGLPRLSGAEQGARGRVVHELVPVRSWQNQIIGIAGGTFDPSRRGFDRVLQHLRRGESGFAELIDAGGTIIASTVPARVGRRTECRAHLGELVKDKRAQAARCDGCHGEWGVKAAAPAELMVFAPLAAAPWGVVVRQRTAEALPTEGDVPWWLVAAGLAAHLGIAAAFAWGAARSVTRPIGVLTGEAERIAGGELDWSIPDLGTDEVGRLGRSLDRMRLALRRLLDDVARVNAELEQRVEERTHALNEAYAQLAAREEARAQLLRKLISAQEDERKRIARELHDETSQSLAVLAMGLEAAQDAMRGGKAPRLEEVKAVAVRTLEDVHRIILDLRPSVLDDLGLLSAIRWYAERQLGTRGMSVRCEFGELDRRLPPEMETALFRICQEAMSNIARHAQATAVLVEVALEDDVFRIDIEDDGRGFDAEAVARREGRRSWGLMGIRERAEILGGSATVESAPGKGTRVEVRIPVPRATTEPGPAATGAEADAEGRGT